MFGTLEKKHILELAVCRHMFKKNVFLLFPDGTYLTVPECYCLLPLLQYKTGLV